MNIQEMKLVKLKKKSELKKPDQNQEISKSFERISKN